MKRTIFLFILVLLITGGGYFLFCNKADGEDSREQSHKGNGDTLSQINDLPIEARILPTNEWGSALIGTWKFKHDFQNELYIILYEGEVTYDSSGTFKKFLQYKYYECTDIYQTRPPATSRDCLRIMSGGSYLGKWSMDVDKLCWWENISKCEISNEWCHPNYTFPNLCKSEFKPKQSQVFGNYEWSNAKEWVESFTRNKIVIKGKNFSSGANYTYIYEKAWH